MKVYAGLVLGIVLAGWMVGSAAPAPIKVKVLKNNVNLRAKPVANAEVVGQVASNDLLFAKTMDNEWVEVVPPTNLDLWILGDYVKDGVIQSRQKVNVRSQPGINFAIVGQLAAGTAVTLRGNRQDWAKIAPPENCSLWVSRSLVKVAVDTPVKVEPIKVATPVIKPEEKPVVAPPPVKPVERPPVPVVLPTNAVGTATNKPEPAVVVQEPPVVVSEVPADLKLDSAKEQGQWKQYDGTLRPRGFFARSPSRYRLVSYDKDGNSTTVCYVRGNEDQLSTLINRPMIISGREYWVSKQSSPVLIPSRIVLK
jgi:uncharacterized protein YraI